MFQNTTTSFPTFQIVTATDGFGWHVLLCARFFTSAKVRVCEIEGEEKTTSIFPEHSGKPGERKREIAVQKHLLLFPQFFPLLDPSLLPGTFGPSRSPRLQHNYPSWSTLRIFPGGGGGGGRNAAGVGRTGMEKRDPHALLMPSQFGAEIFFSSGVTGPSSPFQKLSAYMLRGDTIWIFFGVVGLQDLSILGKLP